MIPIAGPDTALLLDAAGTLLHPAVPVPETYARLTAEHGREVTPTVVSERFGEIMKRAAPLRRDAPDWRPFWRVVVAHCTGSDDPALLDALIDHYRQAEAWTVAAGAAVCCERVRARGMKVVVVSNWDIHLRPLLTSLEVHAFIDAILVSAEERLEKPDPRMFSRACARVGVAPGAAVHVGDDPDDDVAGAEAAGCAALLFGRDVADFGELARVLMP
ncbi:(S)-2-haloacid dehalogenase 4A [Enhygromyxa salina]|uniref:(S)-2-haloacid dehalogenase 4A n=1 Tax=Enhygromyxa salina TaxID=215803 RepID=A0A2S9XD31_9BACT|nr:HAD-IA family hydrolase [Enhygromyxa salina]PRP90779.1 (S)-2-haloacid dehalogenase 4A [Enhygromyxa salina]